MESEDISLTGVTKVFKLGVWKKKVAVQDLTFGVARGQVVGLLGPNGSGKTTTIKMILGFLKPTSGEVIVCGRPASDRMCRNYVGYLPESPRFPRFLTGAECLRYYAALLDLHGAECEKRIEELLQLVGLTAAARERVSGYSKGMTQRLAIAQALLKRPRVLIFDEPMSGLDPIGRMEIRALIQQVHEEMKEATIFFSSHILGDIEDLCSSVIVLRRGQLTKLGKIEDLMTKEPESYRVVAREVPKSIEERFKATNSSRETALGIVFGAESTGDLVHLLSDLSNAGAKIISIGTTRTNLERALFTDVPATEAAR